MRIAVLLSFYAVIVYTSILGESNCRQLSPEIIKLLERVMDNIYHLNTQDIQDIVQQDFGCIPLITAQELYEKMAQDSSLLVINVLSEKWYKDCHIQNSINVPLDKLIYMTDSFNRDQEIIVYCALDACDASEKAYVLLRCLGFTNVSDYHGGIKEWYQLGYPTNGPCAAAYLHEKSGNRFDTISCFIDFDFYAEVENKLRSRYCRSHISSGV